MVKKLRVNLNFVLISSVLQGDWFFELLQSSYAKWKSSALCELEETFRVGYLIEFCVEVQDIIHCCVKFGNLDLSRV